MFEDHVVLREDYGFAAFQRPVYEPLSGSIGPL